MINDERAVKVLVAYVDENPHLKQLKEDIYKDIETRGWLGTSPCYERFLTLFETMRKHYINDNICAGEVLHLNTQGMKNFCQHYVHEFQKQMETQP